MILAIFSAVILFVGIASGQQVVMLIIVTTYLFPHNAGSLPTNVQMFKTGGFSELNRDFLVCLVTLHVGRWCKPVPILYTLADVGSHSPVSNQIILAVVLVPGYVRLRTSGKAYWPYFSGTSGRGFALERVNLKIFIMTMIGRLRLVTSCRIARFLVSPLMVFLRWQLLHFDKPFLDHQPSKDENTGKIKFSFKRWTIFVGQDDRPPKSN